MKTKSQPELEDRTADVFGMTVRFVCGALLGLVFGVGVCVTIWPLSIFGACTLVVFAIAVCGICAAQFGDKFWANLRWML